MNDEAATASYEPVPEDGDKRAELTKEFANSYTYYAPLDHCMTPGCDATSYLGVVRDRRPDDPGMLDFGAVLCPRCAKDALWCTADGCSSKTDLVVIADDDDERELLCPQHAKSRVGGSS